MHIVLHKYEFGPNIHVCHIMCLSLCLLLAQMHSHVIIMICMFYSMTARQIMRAIRIAQFGGPEVLKVETNVPIPTPAPSQV